MLKRQCLAFFFGIISLTIFSSSMPTNSGCNASIISTQCMENSSTSHRIKTRVIINPKSGTHNKKSIEKLIYQLIDQSAFDFEILYTNGPNHAHQLSKEAALLNYDLVIAVGGDGTVNEVGKGLIGSSTAMGIIPSGSGNGLARHLNISSDPQQAIEVVMRFQCVSIDTIQINDDQFIGIAGIGFDAHIAKKFATSKKRGFWSYAGLVLQELPRYESRIFEMDVDGEAIKEDGLLISFANSSQYGNNIKIAPQASLFDGYINIAILKKPPFYSLPDILIKLKNGTVTHSKYYKSICCKELTVHTKNVIAHIDGEPAFFENGINLKVLPKSLKVVVP